MRGGWVRARAYVCARGSVRACACMGVRHVHCNCPCQCAQGGLNRVLPLSFPSLSFPFHSLLPPPPSLQITLHLAGTGSAHPINVLELTKTTWMRHRCVTPSRTNTMRHANCIRTLNVPQCLQQALATTAGHTFASAISGVAQFLYCTVSLAAASFKVKVSIRVFRSTSNSTSSTSTCTTSAKKKAATPK